MQDSKLENYNVFGSDLHLDETEKKAFVRASDVDRIAVRYLWKPYLPLKYITVIQAPGGTGKSFFLCGAIAEMSKGHLPLSDIKIDPVRSLFISAEDSKEIIAGRLTDCDADMNNCFIMDLDDSKGINFQAGDRLDELRDIIKTEKIKFVVIDPLHAFIGDIDMNRANIIRPIMQTFSSFATSLDLNVLLVSHVSKRRAEENANNAGLGSVDIVNASRVVLQLVGDETGEDKNRRVLVHTKSNYKEYGRSIAFDISSLPSIYDANGDEIDRAKIEWIGYSDLDREILEGASRSKCTLAEYMKKHNADKDPVGIDDYVVNLLVNLGSTQGTDKKKYSCEDLKSRYQMIFGDSHVKRVVNDRIMKKVFDKGYIINFPKEKKYLNGKQCWCMEIISRESLEKESEISDKE